MVSALVLLITLVVPVQVDDARARALEAQLMAPCCWSQAVDVHHSPAAEEMKAEIRRLIAQGRTDEEIVARFVAEYGARIRVVPPADGFAATLYVAPVVALVLSGFVIVTLLRRFTRGAPTAPAAPARTVSVVLDERLDDELRGLD